MLLLLFVAQPPNWQKLTFNALNFLSFLPVIPVIIVFLVLLILSDHSFHNLHTSLKRSRISSSCFLIFSLLLIFVIFFIIFVLPFELINIGIPNLPLSDLSSKIVYDWRTSCSSFIRNWSVYGLNLSVFVIKFVLHCLFYSFNIFS